MERTPFFTLDRGIQERFISSARGLSPPVPLATRRDPLPKGMLFWTALAVLGVIGLIVVMRLGYGNLSSPLALQPDWLGAVYIGLGALSVFSALRARATVVARRSEPFPRVVYLFPSGVIDARGATFVVHGTADLLSVLVADRSIALSFSDGGRFDFVTDGRQRGEEIERTLLEAKERLSSGPPSARDFAALDPLIDTGFRNPFSPMESLRPTRARWLWVPPALGLVVGAALGFGCWALRNSYAETALYRAAREAHTKQAYRDYVDRGGKRSEVQDILLPRAELAEVVATRSIDAIERYATSHQHTKIDVEIKVALHRELLLALEETKRAGTRSALREFAKRYGKHETIRPEIQRAVNEHLRHALTEFKQNARPSPEVADFFRRLLGYVEKHDGPVQLRFRRRLGESVKRSQVQLTKSLYYGGPATLPAQYFDDKHTLAREQEIGKKLIAWFGKAFPDDLIHFELGPLVEGDEDFPKVTVPTLIVTHRTEMSGAYLSRNPRAALTGVGVLFRIAFQLPDDDKPHEFKTSAWLVPELNMPPSEKAFENVYEEMGVKAFRKMMKKYSEELLPGLIEKEAPPPPPPPSSPSPGTKRPRKPGASPSLPPRAPGEKPQPKYFNE